MKEITILYIGARISLATSMLMLKRRPSQVQKYFLMASIGVFVYMRAAATKRFITQPLAFEWNAGVINQAQLVAMAGLLL